MNRRSDLSDTCVRHAEIIFAEFYYSVHGHPCDIEIWTAAFHAWNGGSLNLPMVEAAVAAAQAIETGRTRYKNVH